MCVCILRTASAWQPHSTLAGVQPSHAHNGVIPSRFFEVARRIVVPISATLHWGVDEKSERVRSGSIWWYLVKTENKSTKLTGHSLANVLVDLVSNNNYALVSLIALTNRLCCFSSLEGIRHERK